MRRFVCDKNGEGVFKKKIAIQDTRYKMQYAYQRYLTPGFEPFDPLELARETEGIGNCSISCGIDSKH